MNTIAYTAEIQIIKTSLTPTFPLITSHYSVDAPSRAFDHQSLDETGSPFRPDTLCGGGENAKKRVPPNPDPRDKDLLKTLSFSDEPKPGL